MREMTRRDAIGSIVGATAIAAGVVGRSRASTDDDDGSLVGLVQKIGPIMANAPLTVETLGDGLHVLAGPGGNMAVLSSREGPVVMVDSGIEARGAEIAKTAREVAGRPIDMLINTHWHLDHVGGNPALAEAGVRSILASEAAARRVGSEQYSAEFDLKIPPLPPRARPSLAAANLVVDRGDSRLTVNLLPPAHTDGDVYVLIQPMNVLHTGDLLGIGGFPNIDASSGGWIGGMAAATKILIDLCDAKTKVIPGHGPVGTVASLRTSLAMLSGIRDEIEAMLDRGKTIDEVVKADPAARFAADFGHGIFTTRQFSRLAAIGLIKHRAGAKTG